MYSFIIMSYAEGEDYTPKSGTYALTNSSGIETCFNLDILDDPLIEDTEDFFICASSEQFQLTPNCVSVNITDNDGTCTITYSWYHDGHKFTQGPLSSNASSKHEGA